MANWYQYLHAVIAGQTDDVADDAPVGLGVPLYPLVVPSEADLDLPHVVWSQNGENGENSNDGYCVTSVQLALDFRARELLVALNLRHRVITELNRRGVVMGVTNQITLYDELTSVSRVIVNLSLAPHLPGLPNDTIKPVHPDDRRSFSDSFEGSFG